MNEQEMTGYIEWLREGDWFDDTLRGVDGQRQNPGQPQC